MDKLYFIVYRTGNGMWKVYKGELDTMQIPPEPKTEVLVTFTDYGLVRHMIDELAQLHPTNIYKIAQII